MTNETKTRRGQRAFAMASGTLAITTLVATLLMPVLGAFGVGAEIATVDGTCQVVHRLDSPWPAWVGVTIGVVLAGVSAAFAQVAVGETGLGFLKAFRPGGGS